ncbi:MAG: TlpA family protein disulfide reductase [Rhodothermaceae bacterium]|nr:TlpA family protein disulfide reductase [Rhodothermaceae bacterium]
MRTFIFLLVTIWLSGCGSEESPSLAHFKAPPIELASLNNETISLDQFSGQAVVIHFGTSWCPFCRAEDPHLEALYQEYKDQGVQVLVVNVEETDEKASEWKEEAGFSFPMLMDRDGTISASYAPADAQPDLPRHEVMIASNLIIDGEGMVRFMSLLDTNNFDAKLIALRVQLEEVLAEQKDGMYTSID